MLKFIQSLPDLQMGLIDVTETYTQVIVPPLYKSIQLQRGGIIAQNAVNPNLYNAYLFNGACVLQDCSKILFLNNGYILTVGLNNLVYIYNINTNAYLTNIGFESLLVFMGNDPQAKKFSHKINIAEFITSAEYMQYGAYIENWVCGTLNNKWGILDTKSGRLIANFMYKTMVHCKGQKIGAVTMKGEHVRF